MNKLSLVIEEALLIVLMISTPPVLICTIFGLLVAIIQTMTQIQEQTVSFIFKLLSVSFVIFSMGSWMGNMVSTFSSTLFLNLHKYVK